MSDETRNRRETPDDVARLIRLAGRRDAVPDDRSARVKAAVHAAWLAETRGRQRRRQLWTVVTLAAAASLVVAIAVGLMRPRPMIESPPRPIVTVELLTGTAWREAPAVEGVPARHDLGDGDLLPAGALVGTGGDSRLSLRLGSTSIVRLDTGSRVRLVDEETVVLEQGAVYVDSGREEFSPGTLTVRTPLGTIQDIGTQFEVRLGEGSVRVRVREGLAVLDDGRRRHEVPVATELSLDESGAALSRAIATWGPEWAWAEQLSAVPELEGMSARAFLEWVARERGWRLEFEDTDVARSAEEIRIGGSLDHLTLDEALEAVLPTCGLIHRTQEGVLRVASLEAGAR